MVMPDTRAVSLKGVGNQTINTRVKTGPAFGAVQEDQMQGHYHILALNTDAADNSVPDSGSLGTSYDGIVLGKASAGSIRIQNPYTDGTNDTPRTGANTRDSSIGTNFGITY